MVCGFGEGVVVLRHDGGAANADHAHDVAVPRQLFDFFRKDAATILTVSNHQHHRVNYCIL